MLNFMPQILLPLYIGLVLLFIYIMYSMLSFNSKDHFERHTKHINIINIIMYALLLVSAIIKEWGAIMILVGMYVPACQIVRMYNNASYKKIRELQQELEESKKQIEELKEKQESKK